jgi:hypothetical protein
VRPGSRLHILEVARIAVDVVGLIVVTIVTVEVSARVWLAYRETCREHSQRYYR